MMKNSRVLISVAMVCLCLCACGSKEQSKSPSGNEAKKPVAVKDSIDISEIAPALVRKGLILVDWNVTDPEIEEMKNKADIIFEGRLIQAEPYISSDSMSVYSDYLFEVNEMYKGEQADTITINMLGGLMKDSDYLAQLKELGMAVEEDAEEVGDTYTFSAAEGVEPLDLNEEYIVFASWNESKEKYYPTYYYYGLFQKTENGEFVCCLHPDVMETIRDDAVLSGEQGSVERQLAPQQMGMAQYGLDFSQELSDLSVIKEQKITEARIYGTSQVYSTTDEEIVQNIVARISELDLKEAAETDKEVVYGSQDLFLMNGDKVVYHFRISDRVEVGDKEYGTEQSYADFQKNVMEYCRQTFWN